MEVTQKKVTKKLTLTHEVFKTPKKETYENITKELYENTNNNIDTIFENYNKIMNNHRYSFIFPF